MKKTFALIFFSFFIAVSVKAEKIDSFDASITINKDASINIAEEITMNFEGETKHGIFRDIPVIYPDKDNNKFSLQISDVRVTDQYNNPYNFVESNNGDLYDIKIGDADIPVTGVKNYVIRYTIKGAINYFSDHDELYWNVTGNDWSFPILKSTMVVTAPAEMATSSFKYKCFVGPKGSQAECQAEILKPSKGKAWAVGYRNNLVLSPGEGMTVVFSLPKGMVENIEYRLPVKEKPQWLQLLIAYWPAVIPIAVFVIMYMIWNSVGRDSKGRGTIIAEFDAPDNLTPAEVGTIVDDKADNKDISAEIIYLAIKGFLKIEKMDDDYRFVKLKEADSSFNDFQKELFDGLFGAGKEVLLSDLKNKFHATLKSVVTKVYDSTVAKGYFKESPEKVRKVYFVIAAALAFGSFYLVDFTAGFVLFISLVLSGAIIGGFGYIMPAKTTSGALAKDHILGLKEYLNVAEKDRIIFHNAPEKNPATFEKFLPYAMVLGVESAWAKQFEGIYNEPPQWYSDGGMRNFNSIMFVNSLNSFNSEAYTSMASVPASSGGSGFSGGGGGGFGGGGGGSW